MSYEEDLQRFLSLLEQEGDSLWGQAAQAYVMVTRWGRGTARALAGDSGLSAGYIRQLIATAAAFPDPSRRAADMSFSHHRVAAMTDDPAGWMDQAVAEGWSVAELRAAIRAARDPLAAAEQARQAAERLDRAVARFAAQWAADYGATPVLVWQKVAADGAA